MKLIDNYEDISLLVNLYTIHSIKSHDKTVDLRKFIQEVHRSFENKNLSYTQTEILLTWKQLLEEYYYYKKHFTKENASTAWNYFNLMDNCFDRQEITEKFTVPLTFFLIECMSGQREILATKGLTQEVLQNVETHFKAIGDNDITQIDIFAKWEMLKQSYRENRLKMKQKCRNLELNQFYDAMRIFYQSAEFRKPRAYKRRLIGETCVEKIANNNEFSTGMKFHLLMLIKSRKNELGFEKELNSNMLNYIIKEFKKIDCDFSSEDICNEWNDLCYRYELLKNNENPGHWKYFNDLREIFDPAEPVVVESVETGEDSILGENYSKMPELRELMLENHLSGVEMNYLLDNFDT